jgi:cysteine desulfuration protein SufE
MSETIQAKQDEIVTDFGFFTDWDDKYAHIIELGKDLPLIDPAKKSDDNLVRGCQSRVWLVAELSNGKVLFSADSDAIITKGLISLLISVLNDQTPEDILHQELDFVERIGLNEHLSPTRSNGLASMLKQMKLYALAFSAKSEK